MLRHVRLALRPISASTPRSQTQGPVPPAPKGGPDAVWWTVFGIVTLSLFAGALGLIATLVKTPPREGKLSKALSEPGTRGKSGTSRVIALFGLLVNACVILGLGYPASGACCMARQCRWMAPAP